MPATRSAMDVVSSDQLQQPANCLVPLVRLKRAACPSAVLPPGYPPSGAGLTACALGESPKHKRASVISSHEVAALRRIIDFIDYGSFSFPTRLLGSVIASLKRAKNRAGRGLRPESDPRLVEFSKMCAALSRIKCQRTTVAGFDEPGNGSARTSETGITDVGYNIICREPL